MSKSSLKSSVSLARDPKLVLTFFENTQPTTTLAFLGGACNCTVTLKKPIPTIFNKGNAVPISLTVEIATYITGNISETDLRDYSVNIRASLYSFVKEQVARTSQCWAMENVVVISEPLDETFNKRKLVHTQKNDKNKLKSTNGCKMKIIEISVDVVNALGEVVASTEMLRSFAPILANGGNFYKYRAWAQVLMEELPLFRPRVAGTNFITGVDLAHPSMHEFARILRSVLSLSLEQHDVILSNEEVEKLQTQMTEHLAQRVFEQAFRVYEECIKEKNLPKTSQPLSNYIGLVWYCHAIIPEWKHLSQMGFKAGFFPRLGSNSEVQRACNATNTAIVRFRSGRPDCVALHYPGISKAKEFNLHDNLDMFCFSVMLEALGACNITVDGIESLEEAIHIFSHSEERHSGAETLLEPLLRSAKDPSIARTILFNSNEPSPPSSHADLRPDAVKREMPIKEERKVLDVYDMFNSNPPTQLPLQAEEDYYAPGLFYGISPGMFSTHLNNNNILSNPSLDLGSVDSPRALLQKRSILDETPPLECSMPGTKRHKSDSLDTATYLEMAAANPDDFDGY